MTANPVLTRQLVAAGYSHREVAGLTRDGQLVRLRRGAYARPGPADGPEDRTGFDEAERHLMLVAATLPLVSADAVVSHRSAAALHGLPTFSGLDQVALTRSSGSGKRRGYLHLHVAPLPADEVEVRDGVRVTTLARTVVDLARHLPHAEAVAVATRPCGTVSPQTSWPPCCSAPGAGPVWPPRAVS